MTDETTNVGSAGETGATGTPNQSASPPATPPIESEVTKMLAGFGDQFKSLEKQLQGLQSRQDKAETNFQNQLAKFNQIKTQGNLSDDQALAEMQRGDAESQRWAALEQKLDSLADRLASGGTQANDSNAAAKVFEAVGLDLKDIRVASALLKQYKTPEEVRLAAYDLREEINNSPNPTSAQSASMTGVTTPSAQRLDAVYAQYEQAFKEPTKNADLLTSLEAEMKALGG